MNHILPIIATAITFLFGVWALVKPSDYASLISLIPDKEAGISEIRSTYGGLIMGLSGFVLYNQSMVAFQTLGFAYLGLAMVRGVSMFILDGCNSRKNQYILAFEILFSAVLLIT